MPTIKQFSEALANPASTMRTLTDAVAECGDSGLPQTVRTTHTVEAVIRWRSERWLLAMPLQGEIPTHIESLVARLQRIDSPALTLCRVLHGEMGTASGGNMRYTSLLIQHLPEGMPFAEAVKSEPHRVLCAALDALELELLRTGISHNNLKAANLWWTDGRFVPLRYNDAATDGNHARDKAAFAELRRELTLLGRTPDELAPCAVEDHSPLAHITGHAWRGNLFEGLIRVMDSDLYGFVDTQNREVIVPQYLWADDFHEGRAVVKSVDGMGVIDQSGGYVIEARYEIVEYDIPRSLFYVRQSGMWATFDWTGKARSGFTSPSCPEFDV